MKVRLRDVLCPWSSAGKLVEIEIHLQKIASKTTKRKESNQDMFSAHGSQLASLLHYKEGEAAEQNQLKITS